MHLRMLFVLVLCIVCVDSGMEEQLCRMPEFKPINQSNQSIITFVAFPISMIQAIEPIR